MDKQKIDPSFYRRAAISVAACSLSSLDSSVDLIGGGITPWGFYLDFFSSQSLDLSFLSLVEEEMRRLIKKDLPFSILEMVPSSASGYFASQGKKHLASEALSSRHPLLSIVKMDEFACMYTGPLPRSTGCIPYVKIVEIVSLKEGFRLLVGVESCKEALKEWVKSWTPYKERSHLIALEDMKIAHPFSKGWVWLSNGERIKEFFLSFYREFVEKRGFSFLSSPIFSTHHFEFHSEYKSFTGAHKTVELHPFYQEEVTWEEGFLQKKETLSDLGFIFEEEGKLEQEAINCLHFITEMLKIFSFTYRVVLSPGKGKLLHKALQKSQIPFSIEKKLDYLGLGSIIFEVPDGMGRYWTLSSIQERKKRELQVSFIFSLERVLALLLEAKGRLPVWLSPEQVRVVGKKGRERDSLVELLTEHRVRFSCDERTCNLSKKVYDALHERVPFSIVLGSQEREDGFLSVRCFEEKEPIQMTKETLISRLKQLES